MTHIDATPEQVERLMVASSRHEAESIRLRQIYRDTREALEPDARCWNGLTRGTPKQMAQMLQHVFHDPDSRMSPEEKLTVLVSVIKFLGIDLRTRAGRALKAHIMQLAESDVAGELPGAAPELTSSNPFEKLDRLVAELKKEEA